MRLAGRAAASILDGMDLPDALQQPAPRPDASIAATDSRKSLRVGPQRLHLSIEVGIGVPGESDTAAMYAIAERK